MYKLAQLKEAEVRGVVAALVDNGILPVDNVEQFEKVASDTADLLDGYDYDISDVADAASYSMQKMAEEEDTMLALGELALHKVAGDLDADEFDYYADSIVKEAGSLVNAAKTLERAAGRVGASARAAGKSVSQGTKNMLRYGTTAPTAGQKASRAMGKAKDAFLEGLSAKDLKKALGGYRNPGTNFQKRHSLKDILKGGAKAGAAWAPVAAGAGLAGYGAKELAN